MTLYSGSDSALLHDYIEEDFKDRSDAEKDLIYRKCEGTSNTLYLVTMTVSSFAGAWFSQFELAYPYALNAVFAILSILIFQLLPAPQKRLKEGESRRGMKTFLREAGEEMRKSPSLISILLFSSFFFFIFRVVFFVGQDFLKQLHLSSFEAGVVISIATLFATIASKRAWRIQTRIGEEKMLGLIAVLFTVSPLLLGFAQNLFGIGALFLLYVGRGFYMPVVKASVLSRAPRDKKASFLSLMNWGGYLLFALLSPFFGKVSETIGIQYAFWGCALLGCAGLVVMFNLTFKRRERALTALVRKEKRCETL